MDGRLLVQFPGHTLDVRLMQRPAPLLALEDRFDLDFPPFRGLRVKELHNRGAIRQGQPSQDLHVLVSLTPGWPEK